MLKQKISDDLKTAWKAGETTKKSVLNMLLAAIKNKEIDNKGELTDEQIIATISTEIKKRKDSVEQYEKGGRPELAEGEKAEIDVLMGYMPEQLSDDEIRAKVKEAMAETGISDVKEMGKLIGAVMAKVKGQADGTVVSRIVKEELAK